MRTTIAHACPTRSSFVDIQTRHVYRDTIFLKFTDKMATSHVTVLATKAPEDKTIFHVHHHNCLWSHPPLMMLPVFSTI